MVILIICEVNYTNFEMVEIQITFQNKQSLLSRVWLKDESNMNEKCLMVFNASMAFLKCQALS